VHLVGDITIISEKIHGEFRIKKREIEFGGTSGEKRNACEMLIRKPEWKK
jgi:hypothetical protein